MKSFVVNCSKPYYNLGARKLADWLSVQGRKIEYIDGDPGLFGGNPDEVYLSVIFSWQAPLAVDLALRFRDSADVFCGGPGMFALQNWWTKQTGLTCAVGVDPRFENQSGGYLMTFASRGCPVNCYFCIVPRLEGTTFTLNWDFQPAPLLCDNNLSALPIEFQEHIIRRYQETGTKLMDANSGFEPITFDEGTFKRWKPILKGPWRFAFDTTSEEPQVKRMMEILKGESPKRKQVYVLIGNEPIEACYERACKVIEWGGEPYVQPVMPLNALSRNDLKVNYDWDWQGLKDMQRFYNRHLWRTFKLNEYKPRKNELPFSNLKRAAQ